MVDIRAHVESFYSKLVRLKATGIWDNIVGTPKCFYSKLVRLKDYIRWAYPAGEISFYSKLVRLKVCVFAHCVFGCRVSIPNWFD